MTDIHQYADPELVKKTQSRFAPRIMNFDPNRILTHPEKREKTVEEKPTTHREKKETEIGESLKAIRAAEKNFREYLEATGDTNFYFSVVFKSSAEMEAFQKKYGIELHYNDFIFNEDLIKALHLE